MYFKQNKMMKKMYQQESARIPRKDGRKLIEKAAHIFQLDKAIYTEKFVTWYTSSCSSVKESF